MRLIRQLKKKSTDFFFRELMKKVVRREIRPFHIDRDGLWFDTAHGFSVYSNLKDRILELDVNPIWEAMETRLIFKNLSPGEVFVDVGANIGYFSMLAAQKQVKQIVAVEPVPQTFDILKKNITHNQLQSQIDTFNIALGSKVGQATIVSSLGPKNHLAYTSEDTHAGLPTVDVPMTTLDILFHEHPVDRVDFIKVDIEGAEYGFLLGARSTIESFMPMLLLEIEERRLVKFGVAPGQVFGFLQERGYDYMAITEDAITPSVDIEADLKKARNFIFFSKNHHLDY